MPLPFLSHTTKRAISDVAYSMLCAQCCCLWASKDSSRSQLDGSQHVVATHRPQEGAAWSFSSFFSQHVPCWDCLAELLSTLLYPMFITCSCFLEILVTLFFCFVPLPFSLINRKGCKPYMVFPPLIKSVLHILDIFCRSLFYLNDTYQLKNIGSCCCPLW